jgi:hypothetical protein
MPMTIALRQALARHRRCYCGVARRAQRQELAKNVAVAQASADIRLVKGAADQQRAVGIRQQDRATPANLELVVELLEIGDVERRDEDPGETAIRVVDAPYQRDDPSASDPAFDRGVDVRPGVRIGFVKLEVIPVGNVDLLGHRLGGDQQITVGIGHRYAVELRQQGHSRPKSPAQPLKHRGARPVPLDPID